MDDVAVVDELNAAALAKLAAGGKVLLILPPKRVAPDRKLNFEVPVSSKERGRVAERIGRSGYRASENWLGRFCFPPESLRPEATYA